MPKTISVDEVRHLLSYDPLTGIFLWKNPKPGLLKGAVAGTTTPFGYRIIQINKTCFRAHWLAWLMTYGRWPDHVIDHKNLDGCDNRLENLREATHGQNRANSRTKTRKYNLPKGVFKVSSGRFGAQIVASHVHHYLGVFDTVEAAHAAYMAKAEMFHGEFARGV